MAMDNKELASQGSPIHWDKKYGQQPLGEVVRRVDAVGNLKIARYALRTLTSRSKLLEAGSGTGRILNFLARQTDCAGFGLDYSEGANRLARSVATKLHLRCEYVAGDLMCIPFGDNSFDVVVSDSVIEHLRDPRLAVREIARVTAPGGLIFATVPNSLRPDGWDLYRRLRKLPYLQRSFHPAEFGRMFREAGADPVEYFGDTFVLLRNFVRIPPATAGQNPGESDRRTLTRLRKSAGRCYRWSAELGERLLGPYLLVNIGVIARKRNLP